MTPPVVAIVGLSDSGKTRIAVALIELLAAQGYRIVAVKHGSHGHQVDRPATDSARLYAAGAIRVVLSSPGQITSIERTEADTTLEEIAASLDSSYDLVIAEGFKGSTVPKVLVVGDEELIPPPENVIAVVGEHVTGEDVPHYSFEEAEGLARQIREQVLTQAPGAPAAFLEVNGVPVPLGSSTSTILSEVVIGFLKALRDIPEDPRSVRIVLRR